MAETFPTTVVGIYYCRGHIRGIQVGDVLRITREPNNPHDTYAVRVELWNGELLGRVPLHETRKVATAIDTCAGAYAVVTGTTPAHDHHPARCSIVIHVVSNRAELPDFSSKPAPRQLPRPAIPGITLTPPCQFRASLEGPGDFAAVESGDVLSVTRDTETPQAFKVEKPLGTLVGYLRGSDAQRLGEVFDTAAGVYAVAFYRANPLPGIRGGRCDVDVKVVTDRAEMPDFSSNPVVEPRAVKGKPPGADHGRPVATPPQRVVPPPLVPPAAVSAKPRNDCFVATAVFRDPAHPSVLQLRNWRDSVLVRHASGRAFVKFYYAVGPSMARMISAFPIVRPFLAAILKRAARYLGAR